MHLSRHEFGEDLYDRGKFLKSYAKLFEYGYIRRRR